MNMKLFAELVESMTQMNEIARGEFPPSRVFRDGRRLISAAAIARFVSDATARIAPSRERAHANSVRQFPLTFVRASGKKRS